MKCPICGREKDIVIKCNLCHRKVCLFCFSASLGLCSDCIVVEYNEHYRNTIIEYEGGKQIET